MPQSPLFAISAEVRPIGKMFDVRTANVLFPDLNKSIPELRNSEGVNDGIDGGVAVTEQDSNIEEIHRIFTGGTEKSDAVQDVQRQPADGKQEKHKRERFGQLQFFSVISSWVGLVGGDLLIKLHVDHVEDLGIDEQHQDEGWQHPAEEVEIDHVLHTDDVLKLAGYEKVRTQSLVGLP